VKTTQRGKAEFWGAFSSPFGVIFDSTLGSAKSDASSGASGVIWGVI